MPIARLGDRSLFPRLEATAYLAHASVSPFSEPVRERIEAVAGDFARGGLVGLAKWAPELEVVRERLGRLIGAPRKDVCFVSNTSHGVIDIAFGLPWKRGDRVLLFEGEFPANVLPWQQASRAFELMLDWLSLEPFRRSIEEGLADFAGALRRGVRLVAVSAVQYRTGLRMPLAQMATLCREHGAELFVDGIQAVGATPIDVSWGIDYLSCGSHKWLMGPEGAGLLYIAPERLPGLEARLAGWLSYEDGVGFLMGDHRRLRYDLPLRRDAQVFEIGTPNLVGLCGLGASVELLLELGTLAIHAHCNRYLDRLESGLITRGFRSWRTSELAGRSTLLSVEAPEDVVPGRLAKALRDRNVCCNTPDGLVRFSPHWPNAYGEVPSVLTAVDEALAELRR